MSDERRDPDRDDRRRGAGGDRRARTRNGRRTGEAQKPWYVRNRLWLAIASLAFVGWRRVTGRKSGA